MFARLTALRRRTRRLGFRPLVLCVGTLAGLFATSSLDASASTKFDWSGHWDVVDVCTGGWCAGANFPGPFDLIQTGSKITGTNGQNPVLGTASGASAAFTSTYGSYVAHFHITMAASEDSFTGTWTDSQGGSGTTSGVRPVAPSCPSGPGGSLARASAASDCTSTTLRCLSSTQPTPVACVVTVTDMGSQPTPPTGLVTTALSPLPYLGPSCVLMPTPAATTRSVCTLNWNAPGELTNTVSLAIVATYNGDGSHSSSSGSGAFTLSPEVPPPSWSSKAGKDILSKSGDYLAASVFLVKYGPEAAKIPGVTGVPQTLAKGGAGRVLGIAAIGLAGGAVLDKYIAPNFVDPFDPHYAVVAVARLRRVVVVPPGVPDRTTLQSYVNAMERQFAVTTALETTENRATSAKRVGDNHAYRLQEQAISRYLGELADLIDQRIASQTVLQLELDKLLRAAHVAAALHPRIPASSLALFHAAEAFGSLTSEETRVLSELGVSGVYIDDFVASEVNTPIPATIDMRTVIANHAMLAAERKEAGMLRAEARKVPL